MDIHVLSDCLPPVWCNCLRARLWCEMVVGSIHGRVKPKTLKLVFAASPLSTRHLGVEKDWSAQSHNNIHVW